jgi:hypothetical protein
MISYVLIGVGLLFEIGNVWILTHTRQSGVPLIPPLIIIGAMSTAFDWPITVRVGCAVGAVIVHFGLPWTINRLGLSYRK